MKSMFVKLRKTSISTEACLCLNFPINPHLRQASVENSSFTQSTVRTLPLHTYTLSSFPARLNSHIPQLKDFTMSTWNALLFLSIIPTSIAIPLETRGTDCNPSSMTVDEVRPQLFWRLMRTNNLQRVWDCPHKYMLDSSGSCSGNIPKTPSPGCTAYCEMSLAMGYGEEIPIPEGYCGDQTPNCPWQASKTVSNTQTWEVNTNLGLSTREEAVPESAAPEGAALTASFTVGASYSYSKTLSYTTSAGAGKILGPGQCGCEYNECFEVTLSRFHYRIFVN